MTFPCAWVSAGMSRGYRPLLGDYLEIDPTDGSHQFLRLKIGIFWAAMTAHKTVTDVVIEETEGNLVQRRSGRIDLGHHIDAVPVVLNHPRDASNLPLDLRQSNEELFPTGRVAPRFRRRHEDPPFYVPTLTHDTPRGYM